MKRKWLLMLASMLLCAALAFPTGKQEEAKSGPKVLQISWWGSPARNERTQKVLDLYQKIHPEVKFEAEITPWNGYWEKKAAQAAGGTLPDVVQQDYAYIKPYAQKGLMLGLNQYVQKNLIDLRDADPASYEGGKVGDELYGINLGSNSPCLIYDPELLKKAGLPNPDSKLTWDDYVALVNKLHGALGIYGDGDVPNGYNNGVRYIVRQNGERYYAEDGTRLAYSNDGYFIANFARELALIKAGAIPDLNVRKEVVGTENQLIVSGKAAMLSSYQSNQLIAIQKAANRPLNITLLPRDPAQKRPGQWIKAAMFFSIAKTSKFQDAAADFINYFVNDVEANKVLFAERGVPIPSKVRAALRPMLDETNVKMFDYLELATKNASPIDPPDPPGHAEVDKLLLNTEGEIMYGKISVEEAAKKFRKEADRILSEAMKK